MRIKIVKSAKPTYWYADQIGNEFNVKLSKDEDIWRFVRTDDDSYLLNLEDCEPINEDDGFSCQEINYYITVNTNNTPINNEQAKEIAISIKKQIDIDKK